MSRTRANMTTAQVVAILSREKPFFLEGLTQVEAETVAAKATIQRYNANTMITNEAHPASHLFLLLEGAARGYVLTSRGERIGLGWSHDGQLLGWAAIISRQLDYIVSFEAVKNLLAR
jgi:CRP-like cAMP-binding protein